MAYSMDYRLAVLRAYDECGSSLDVAGQFGCSASWVRALVAKDRVGESVEPRPSARLDDQRVYDDDDERAIRAFIKHKPDATLAEVAAAIGKPAGAATVSRTLKRLNLPRKKSRPTPPSKAART